MEESKQGMEWLKQLEGTWITSSGAADAPAANKGVMKSRMIGELWLVNESTASVGSMNVEALQTIGYDKEKKQFTSSWIDSFLNYQWLYTGTLDEAGKVLTFEATGPDMSKPDQTREYRDIYELKSENEIVTTAQIKNEDGDWETMMTGRMTRPTAKTTVTPFLMFIGKAEEAIDFYKTVFNDLRIESMKKYGAGEAGDEGTVKLAEISIAEQKIKITDSPPVHDFTFTPSFSLFVDCESEQQLMERFGKFSDGGKVMMPPNNYGFSKKFAWVSDKFGVSWQLNLP